MNNAGIVKPTLFEYLSVRLESHIGYNLDLLRSNNALDWSGPDWPGRLKIAWLWTSTFPTNQETNAQVFVHDHHWRNMWLFLDALPSLKTMLDINSLTFLRLQSITECYRVLASVTEYYKVLESVTEYYRVLQSITECYRVLQSITEYYRVLKSITKYYRVLQSITE